MQRMRGFTASVLASVICAAIAASWAPAQTSGPSAGTTGGGTALRIHVTAVQGGGQFRPDANSKWQKATEGLDLPEGVELRTGPKGSIQFTVGTDQIFRVDRLTVVKVLRANLMDDGTIRTDVGMTYGRVSKDVDLPVHPHVDTIISPSTTLAVRGTHVSSYDQPPYTPQAWSLTGAATWRNTNGQLVYFGSKGGGTSTVAGNTTGAGQYQLHEILLDPLGEFSGRTGTETQFLLNTPGGLIETQVGVVPKVEAPDIRGSEDMPTTQPL